MGNFESKKFTEPAVLFALTGHVFIRKDASLEYYQQCLREIHDDEIYKFVMGNVPDIILENLWETMGAETQDVDPIIAAYLCRENSILASIKDYSDKTAYPKSKKTIEKRFLKNGYIEVSPIDFMSFCELADANTKSIEKAKTYK